MLNKINQHYFNIFTIAAITLLIATGCSTVGKVKEKEGISIERIDSQDASITHAYLTRSGNTLSVRGEVKRNRTGRGPIPGHLHITLIDPTGHTLKEADIGYMRRNTNSSMASFNATLPIELAPGSTIKITHFNTKTHKTFTEDAKWREGEH